MEWRDQRDKGKGRGGEKSRENHTKINGSRGDGK